MRTTTRRVRTTGLIAVGAALAFGGVAAAPDSADANARRVVPATFPGCTTEGPGIGNANAFIRVWGCTTPPGGIAGSANRANRRVDRPTAVSRVFLRRAINRAKTQFRTQGFVSNLRVNGPGRTPRVGTRRNSVQGTLRRLDGTPANVYALVFLRNRYWNFAFGVMLTPAQAKSKATALARVMDRNARRQRA